MSRTGVHPSVRVDIYSRPNCHLCDDAKDVIERVAGRLDRIKLNIVVTDVDQSAQLKTEYGTEIPVVLLNGSEAFRHRVDERAFERKVIELWNKSTS